MGYREDVANRKKCSNCTHYEVCPNNMGTKCWHPDNVYNNWLGKVNKLTPETKNHNGGCKDYEEILGVNNSAVSES
jgi:hypothetical protein